MTDESYMELVERQTTGPFRSEQESYEAVPPTAVDIRSFEEVDGWHVTWRRTIRGPGLNLGTRVRMTDEEAREDIRTGHGFRPDYVIESLLACYERYRTKGLSPSDSAGQANLYYLASHAAASFDVKTGLYSAI